MLFWPNLDCPKKRGKKREVLDDLAFERVRLGPC